MQERRMQIGSPQWIDLISDGAARLGLGVEAAQAARFAEHARLLADWNRKINLTAISDPLEVAVKHFLDSIAPLPHIPAPAHLLDIGSGGGFPGLPLKVMRPDQPMTLIDASRKKANFMRHVIRQLRLPQVEALHMRAEDLAGSADHPQHFGAIICRALSDLPAIVALAAPLLAPGGRIIAMKGPRREDDAPEAAGQEVAGQEIAGQEAARQTTGSYSTRIGADDLHFRVRTFSYQLPFLEEQRRLVILDHELLSAQI